MHTTVPLVTKPIKSSRFRLWATVLFFTILCASASAVWAQKGLHYTAAEVAVWRQRANASQASATTNYRIPGDVQANSPGDWRRIYDCATEFNNFPAKYRYTLTPAQYAGGCIPKNDQLDPKPVTFPANYTINGHYHYSFARGEGVMDAAFVDLLLGTTTYLATVKQELLWHANPASAPHLNFADASIWCRERSKLLFDTSPGFAISELMMKFLFAYDCYKGQFSAAEKATLDKWFGDAGNYFQNGLNEYYQASFSDWGTGDTLVKSSYINTENNPINRKYPMYYDVNGNPSDSVGIFGQSFNNRMATTAGFVGTVGVFLKNPSLKASAKRFFIQWLHFGVYPSMDIADMSRAQQQLTASNDTVTKIEPEKGFDYAMGYAFVMTNLADVFARDGDMSLYNYSTRHGYTKSQVPGLGTPKSLLGVIQNLQKYMNGTHNRYSIHSIPGRIGTDTISNGNPNYRINGFNPPAFSVPGDVVYDTWFSLANKYYRNASVTQNYLRQASGTRPYPTSPKYIGNNHPWGGAAAVLPGILFMYGQMENTTASPYSQPAVLTWNNPAAITYGTALSATQLNATANTVGTFTYIPNTGSVLGAGTKNLIVNFAPSDTFNFKATSDTVQIIVNKATPVITWNNPIAITYGTALSGTQLNATANTAGSFAYTPVVGGILNAGVQTLSVLFTPTDTANYTTATRSVPITVNQAVPAITWSAPAAIGYGTPLSSAQLNATSSVAGSFVYTPGIGTVLPAGTHTLSVVFTPSSSNYTTATKSVVLVVNKATVLVTWPTPADIMYGTALSSTQLNATAPIAGSFAYAPSIGAVLNAGAQTLSVVFTPSSANYNNGTKSVTIIVNQAVPVLTWNNPAAITYGTALSSTQLNATAPIAGSFDYAPSVGTVLNSGIYTLSVNFTPTSANYTTATKTVPLTVNCTATGTILREYWANVTGTAVAAIPVNTVPTSTSQMTSFQGPLPPVGQYGIADNYAARYRGYLCVPTTGAYTFWISSDNDGELFLSTDLNPANKVSIAYIKDGITYSGQWTKYPSQQSVLINLVAGRSYYIEALHKEAGGGDQLQIGWRLPTSAANATPVVIPGSVLSPFVLGGGARTLAGNGAELERTSSRISVFPNPSSGKVFVEFTTNTTEHASVNMYDMWGGLVHPLFEGTAEKGKVNRIEMEGRQFASGLYIIRLVTPAKADFQKLIITK